MRHLFSISAKNFLSLEAVRVELQELSVLVGPNGAGKSNLLKVIQFLGDTARLDLNPAIRQNGGFERIAFRGGSPSTAKVPRISLTISGKFTSNSSSSAPDEYTLAFSRPRQMEKYVVSHRSETFVFKRTSGPGRRITVSGRKVNIEHVSKGVDVEETKVSLASTSSALSTLPKLGKDNGGSQINALVELLTNFRVFEVDVTKAKLPSTYNEKSAKILESNAGNLASFLRWLSISNPSIFHQYVEDLNVIAPSITDVIFTPVGGSNEAWSIQLKESGLTGLTHLSEASFGTVRAMALLAMLHDPNPPKLTCVEEIDHGLHPHALDRIVERLRSASKRTQLLIVTHSPALANRLRPNELIVCERNRESGASDIPAIAPALVAKIATRTELRLGELWFSGALGGGL